MYLDEAQVLSIPFEKKFVARANSMQHVVSVLKQVMRLQLQNEGGPAVKRCRYTADSLIATAALQAAAQRALLFFLVQPSRKPARWRALVATIIKFLGKGHGALTFSNLLIRNALWTMPPRHTVVATGQEPTLT